MTDGYNISTSGPEKDGGRLSTFAFSGGVAVFAMGHRQGRKSVSGRVGQILRAWAEAAVESGIHGGIDATGFDFFGVGRQRRHEIDPPRHERARSQRSHGGALR